MVSEDNSTGHGERRKKRRGRKTILKNGQGWSLLDQLQQLKTRLGGKGLL